MNALITEITFPSMEAGRLRLMESEGINYWFTLPEADDEVLVMMRKPRTL